MLSGTTENCRMSKGEMNQSDRGGEGSDSGMVLCRQAQSEAEQT
jgi:hypothetical protein